MVAKIYHYRGDVPCRVKVYDHQGVCLTASGHNDIDEALFFVQRCEIKYHCKMKIEYYYMEAECITLSKS